MDFEAIIRKNIGEDGSVSDVGKLASAIASAVGRDFVPKDRYNAKLDEIETLKTEKQTAEDSATAAAGWKKKHDDLKQSFEDYKAEIAGKESLSAKQRAFRKLLTDKNIAPEDADLIVAATDFGAMEMDGESLKDAEKHMATIETKYGRYIPEVQSKGDKPATPPEGKPGSDANAIRAKTAKWHADKYGAATDGK